MSVNFTPTQNSYKDISSFKFWCQKILPAVYDDSLSYYELLNKVVAVLNDVIENHNKMGTDIRALYEAYTLLQNWVNHYFDNLSVQREINLKLDSMSKDGSLSVLLNPLFDDYKRVVDGEIAKQNESIANSTITQNGRISVLEQRMGTFTKLDEGSTTGDAEIADARIGANGVEYDTLGSAIRGQFEEAENRLYDITVSPNLVNPNDPDYLVNKRLTISGGIPSGSADGVDSTGFIPVKADDLIAVYATTNNDPNASLHNQTHNARIWAYDGDKQFIEGSAWLNPGSGSYYTVPEGSFYIRVSFGVSTFPYWAVVHYEGKHKIPYQPFGKTYKIKPSLYIASTNLSDFNNDVDFVSLFKGKLALPKIIYTFAGINFRTFIRNIYPYDLNDIYVRMTTGNKGNLYSKYWIYKPNEGEDVTVRYNVEDKCYRPLNNDSVTLRVVEQTSKESLRVLVIGDSTVNAGVETQKMLDLANSDGYELTLLGTRGSGANQHEGRGGWTAQMYVSTESTRNGEVVNAFYNPETLLFDFSYYMTQQGYDGVDCVFIQLGINDLFSYKTDTDLQPAIETYLECLQTMIDSIHTYDNNINIVLNLIIPCADSQDMFTSPSGGNYGVVQTTWRCKKNTYLGNLAVIDKFSDTPRVWLSPFNAAIDTTTMMDGGVHPINEGYELLGTQMYSYMRAIN